MSFIRTLLIGLSVSFVLVPLISAGAGLQDNVPRDAFGFVLVRNLARIDAHAEDFAKKFGVHLPGPLAMIESFAGISEGLDRKRNLMIVVLPAADETRPFELALWLPTSDYDGLVRSLEGDPERPIAVVTIAGEDLLATRHADWAVVMDPGQRRRLERIQAARASSPPLADWSVWIADNDIVLVAASAGLQTLWADLPKVDADSRRRVAPSDDELFGPPSAPSTSSEYWAKALISARAMLAESPKLEQMIVEAQGVGCAVKLDDGGGATVGLRIALPSGLLDVLGDEGEAPSRADAAADDSLPLLAEEDFVVVGSGAVSRKWSDLVVAPYLHNLKTTLADSFGVTPEVDDIAEFRDAVEVAVADVQGFSLLAAPGKDEDGAFANDFLFARVVSDEAFLAHVDEAMKRWNQMFERDGVALRLVFESEPVTVAGRRGTEYSIDMASAAMAAAFGVQPSPEVRQTMESLFGPGGKFRIQTVSVDEQTVLLAVATQQQAAEVIERFSAAAPSAATSSNDVSGVAAARELLSDRAAWRIYFSPTGYVRWMKRRLDAMLGPVIGGPIVRDMPATPPIGVAGGTVEKTAWMELVVPGETLETLGDYLQQ